MNISVVLVDHDTLVTNKAKVIASNIPIVQFDAMAKKKGFNIKKQDTSLTGYYYANDEGTCLVSCPSFHEKDSIITYEIWK